jgi:hypothetical protein
MPVAVEKKELSSVEVAEAAEGMFAPAGPQAMDVECRKPMEMDVSVVPSAPPLPIETGELARRARSATGLVPWPPWPVCDRWPCARSHGL